jgi:hypothetical protein
MGLGALPPYRRPRRIQNENAGLALRRCSLLASPRILGYDRGQFRREVVNHSQGGAEPRGAAPVRREDALM